MKGDLLITLYTLALMGAHRKPILISTTKLAERLGVSQQTASRRLLDLEKNGMIRRELSPRGSLIYITEKGMKALRDLYEGLAMIFEAKKELKGILTLKGKVFTGLGEGAYYVTIPYYYKQFSRILGGPPYPGTLNLRLEDEESLANRKFLDSMPGIYIPGFSDERRSYGGVKCFKVLINGEEGLLLLIERTHYPPNVIEIISKKKLREALSLKDGDLVTVKVLL
ncbi:MAG: riboflavin kinase [Thermoprotei archaeon]|nr:MAG: riboflavin kinase [Thermoprotei archaeon]RLF20919.1 MAG: riboflavin kinase [Thermoprotei archaeon]